MVSCFHLQKCSLQEQYTMYESSCQEHFKKIIAFMFLIGYNKGGGETGGDNKTFPKE